MRSSQTKAFAAASIILFFIALIVSNSALVNACKEIGEKIPQVYKIYYLIAYPTCVAALIVNFTDAGRFSFPLIFSLFFFDFIIGQFTDQEELLLSFATIYGLILIGMLFAVISSYFDFFNDKAKTVLLIFLILILVIYCLFNFINFVDGVTDLNQFNELNKDVQTLTDEMAKTKRQLTGAVFTPVFIGLSYIFAMVTKILERNE